MTAGTAVDPIRRAVDGWLRQYAPAGPIVLAVSGGADSLALAAAVAGAGRSAVTTVTVDHDLQPGSAEQAARAAQTLRSLGFADVRVARVSVAPGRDGIEAAARRARYAALSAVSTECGGQVPAPVLLAHTLDDQAETVLLGLARGSGPRSIAGMRRWRAPWGRPLLGVRRFDTEKACRAAGLQPWDDPHNRDPAFTRVRLRAEILPLLEQVLGGGVAGALARTADLMADDLDALDVLAEQALGQALQPLPTISTGDVGSPRPAAGLDCAALQRFPAAVRRRTLRRWLALGGVRGLTADHLCRTDGLLAAAPGARVRLPGAVDVIREADRLSLGG